MIPLKDNIAHERLPFVSMLIFTASILVFLYEIALGRNAASFFYAYGFIPAKMFSLAGAISSVTHIFLHAGFMHLFGNLLFFYIFADNVEDRLGHFRFLLFFVGVGISAAIIHALFNLKSTIPAVGASGAISGIMGAYCVLFPEAKILTFIVPFFRVVDLPAFFFLGLWFLIQLFWGIASLAPSAEATCVAFWAHIGGFVAGILLLKVFRKRLPVNKLNTVIEVTIEEEKKESGLKQKLETSSVVKWLLTFFLVMICVGVGFLVFSKLYRDILKEKYAQIILIRNKNNQKPEQKQESSINVTNRNYKVEGIVYSEGTVPSVMIDKRVYHIGDSVGGAKIMDISPGKVTVSFQGESRGYGVGGLIGAEGSTFSAVAEKLPKKDGYVFNHELFSALFYRKWKEVEVTGGGAALLLESDDNSSAAAYMFAFSAKFYSGLNSMEECSQLLLSKLKSEGAKLISQGESVIDGLPSRYFRHRKKDTEGLEYVVIKNGRAYGIIFVYHEHDSVFLIDEFNNIIESIKIKL